MSYILPISKIDTDHKEIVGAKAYSLAQLYQHDLPICKGFVITGETQSDFFKQNDLARKIRSEISMFDLKYPESILSAVSHVQKLILSSKLPEEFTEELFENYDILVKSTKSKAVSIRTSLITEKYHISHSPYLNIIGEHTLAELIKEIYSHMITPQYLLKYTANKIPTTAIVVQQMFDSECSGFLHTIDPHTLNKRVFTIEAIWGLAEILRSSRINIDKYNIDKQSKQIVLIKTYPQYSKMVLQDQKVKDAYIPPNKQLLPKLRDKQILELGKLAKNIASIATTPQTAEWGFDGAKFTFFQTQPLVEPDISILLDDQTPKKTLPILLEGRGENPGIGKGILTFGITTDHNYQSELVVVRALNYDDLVSLKNTEGIISLDDDPKHELKYFCQQYGIPLVNLAPQSSQYLKRGMMLTIDGKTGLIYKGRID